MSLLVLSVHPDDETLGAGGSILAEVQAGREVHWRILTRAHEPQWSREVIETKSREVDAVAAAYGMASHRQLDFPAAMLDTVAQNDLLGAIRDAIVETKPTEVWLIHGGDINSDHRAAFDAAMSVLKPFHLLKLGVKRVLSWETLSSTEAAPPLASRMFLPTVLRDITPHLGRKIEIMNLFASEGQPALHPRGDEAIRALARFRGATLGVEYAEAFMLIRECL